MKEEKEDSIDKLFGGGLQNPGDEVSYQEGDWIRMERMLDGKKPGGMVTKLVYIASAAAAIVLLALGWLFLAPVKPTQNNTQVAKIIPHIQKDSGTYGSPAQQRAAGTQMPGAAAQTAVNTVGKGSNGKSFFTLSADGGDRTTTGPVITTGTKQVAVITPKPDTITEINKNNIAVNTPATKQDTITEIASKPAPAATLATVTNDVKPKKVKVSVTTPGFRPTLSLGIVASPDINSVKTFANARVGTNAGIVVKLGLSPKWSISTGAIYADKPYTTGFANYSTNYPFKTTPTSVTASCMVLDIPLNVGYQFYNKNRNKFSLGTGLSSYFMLRENYVFNHDAAYGTASTDPWEYHIKNQNRHIMGILNLNATYQREVSSKLDLGIQPYMKLPLTSIGYGQVDLKSAGVAVSLMWNLNTGTKPK